MSETKGEIHVNANENGTTGTMVVELPVMEAPLGWVDRLQQAAAKASAAKRALLALENAKATAEWGDPKSADRSTLTLRFTTERANSTGPIALDAESRALIAEAAGDLGRRLVLTAQKHATEAARLARVEAAACAIDAAAEPRSESPPRPPRELINVFTDGGGVGGGLE